MQISFVPRNFASEWPTDENNGYLMKQNGRTVADDDFKSKKVPKRW